MTPLLEYLARHRRTDMTPPLTPTDQDRAEAKKWLRDNPTGACYPGSAYLAGLLAERQRAAESPFIASPESLEALAESGPTPIEFEYVPELEPLPPTPPADGGR